jgi:hypothetical protein
VPHILSNQTFEICLAVASHEGRKPGIFVRRMWLPQHRSADLKSGPHYLVVRIASLLECTPGPEPTQLHDLRDSQPCYTHPNTTLPGDSTDSRRRSTSGQPRAGWRKYYVFVTSRPCAADFSPQADQLWTGRTSHVQHHSDV